LSPVAAFVGAGLGFSALYLAAGVPSPLFVLYQQQWGFPTEVLTIAFAVYALGLLLALLTTGSLSDHLGRRPVLVVALAVELGAMLMFLFAGDIGWVIVARAVQGLATGAATSAYTAALVELAPVGRGRIGAVIAGAAPAGGLGVGALLAGAAIAWAPHPSAVVFTVLSVVMVLAALAVAVSPETVARRPGALASLAPRVAIPRAARTEFAAAVPVHLSAWMLAALYIGLVPTVLHGLFDRHDGLLDGVTVFLEPGIAAVAGLLLAARLSPRRTTVLGGVAVLAGAGLFLAGVTLGVLPLLWIAGVVGGVGFGGSFSGALRTISPLALPQERAGLFAGVYLIAYLAFGVPAIVAGFLVGPLGLFVTVLVFTGAIAVGAVAGLLAQTRLATRERGRTAPEIPREPQALSRPDSGAGS
jgi:MFS family permease